MCASELPRRPLRAALLRAAVLSLLVVLFGLPIGFEGWPVPARADDDLRFLSLPERVLRADEVILAETTAVSDDGGWLTVGILRSVKDQLCASGELTLAHPRLATSRGFVRFQPGSRFVSLLFRGVDDVWRPVEWGESTTFPVRDEKVLIPSFYEPGVELPATGPPLAIPLGPFFAFLDSCRENDEEACWDGFRSAVEAGRAQAGSGRKD